MTKICNKCKLEKDIDLFVKAARYKDGRRNTCKSCHTDYMVDYYKNNPDKVKEKIRMNNYYKPNWRKHGISEAEYKKMLQLYKGKCHVCKIRPAVAIDHDHKCCDSRSSCGKCIRGVLCHPCNMTLGLVGDSKKILLNLIKYIS